MATKPMIKDCLSVLNVCGSNPINQNTFSRIRAVGTVILLVHFSTEFLLNAIFNWDGWKSLEPLTMYAAFNMVIYKIIYNVIKKNEFAVILNDIEQFWSWENLEPDVQQRIKHVFQSGIWSIFFFIFAAMFALAMFYTKALATRSLPFETYHPTNRSTPYYELMFGLEGINCSLAICGEIGFDAFFISLVIHVVCELKIVKQKLCTINTEDEENSLREINQLIHHHNLILRCIKNLNKVFAAMLLVQFSVSIILVCSGLLFVASGGFPPDLREMTKFIPYLVAASAELFTYCLAGEYLINETESVSDAIYESDWWIKTHPKFRRACVLIIQRSNKTEYLSAGGVFILNLETYTKIMKLALSFFSLARATYQRNEIL